jgi:hypothetical protein
MITDEGFEMARHSEEMMTKSGVKKVMQERAWRMQDLAWTWSLCMCLSDSLYVSICCTRAGKTERDRVGHPQKLGSQKSGEGVKAP